MSAPWVRGLARDHADEGRASRMALAFAELGLLVGLILALTGAGGGILAVPLLVFASHIGVAQAGPIGLMAVGTAAALGAVPGLRAGVVRYRAALLVALLVAL